MKIKKSLLISIFSWSKQIMLIHFIVMCAILSACENHNHDLDASIQKGELLNTKTPSLIMPLSKPKNLDKRKIALGKLLFHDKRLSKDESISCASCHDLKKAGTDGLRNSVGIGGSIGNRNSPSVFNVVNNVAQFWDGRARTLEDQIDGPVNNPIEMGSDWDTVISKLELDNEIKYKFKEIYREEITVENIKNAIATFERSLVSLNAPFDRYLLGETDAITDDARQGYQLFKSYGCIACHQGKNIGGNMYQELGVIIKYQEFESFSGKAVDYGRFQFTNEEADKFVFKVPSLRNVALTAPYMHDGSVYTLKEAISYMAFYQLGRNIPEDDQSKLISFLESLTGDLSVAYE